MPCVSSTPRPDLLRGKTSTPPATLDINKWQQNERETAGLIIRDTPTLNHGVTNTASVNS